MGHNQEEKDIRFFYNFLIEKSITSLKHNKIGKANRYLSASSFWAYTFFLTYKDSRADELTKEISRRITKCSNYQLSEDKNRCCFIDSLSIYNGGLTIQYMRAIESAGWDVLYVAVKQNKNPLHKQLIQKLSENPRVEFLLLDNKPWKLEQIQKVYDAITEYCPSRLFIHISPYDPSFVEVCYALPKAITKFIINYTDHSFLLGSDCADYVFEFRHFGACASVKYRNLLKRQQLCLPFYSNIDDLPFEGLPSICDGKQIIFSGATLWKIFDEDDSFFKLCRLILDESPNAIIVFAGQGEVDVLNDKIIKYGLVDRFVFLGWRLDISELFRHCDVYLSTYPFGGGLMSVFAAINEKPILALKGSGVNEIVGQLNPVDVEYSSFREVAIECKRLLNDSAYYKNKGQLIRRSVVDKEWFDNCFKEEVESCSNQGPNMDYSVDSAIKQESINHTIQHYYLQSNGAFIAIYSTLRLYVMELPIRFTLRVSPDLIRLFVRKLSKMVREIAVGIAHWIGSKIKL